MYCVLNTEISMSNSKNPIVFQGKVSLSASSTVVMLSKVSGVGVLQANSARWSCVMLQCYIGTQESKGLFGLPNAADFNLYAGWKLFVPRPSTVVFLFSSQAPRHPFNDTRGRNSRGVPRHDAGKTGSHELAVSVRGVGHDGIQPAFIQSVLPSYSPILVVVVSLQG